jgi:hydroxymethylglutaryl-CoA lyase
MQSRTAATGITARDVTLRDGLQTEAPLPTEAKLTLLDALLAAGVADLELNAFVSPARVPAMADAETLATAARDRGARAWGLVLNRRGAERALAAGMGHLQYVVSVSPAHSRANAGREPDRAMDELEEVMGLAQASAAAVELTLATAFGCPFTGPVPVDAVLGLAARGASLGVSAIGLADTIGTAVPHEVRALTAAVRAAHPGVEVGLHLHDTRGLALANALAGIEVGATRVDGTLAGLGGCPFAPGATGNLAIEDLVHCLHESRMPTGIDLDALLDAGRLAARLTGRAQAGHVAVAGPRFARLHPVPA